MDSKNRDVMMKEFEAMLKIDSPSGYYEPIQKYLTEYFKSLGIASSTLTRGGVLADLGGEGDDIVISAHVDTIGLMVRRIKPNGPIAGLPPGGLRAINAARENVRLHTRGGKVYTGTLYWEQGSLHVCTHEYFDKMASFEYEDGGVELVLDENVTSAAECEALGVRCGDIVAVVPRPEYTQNGFIKTQFLDDKVCAAIMLAYAEKVKRENIALKRRVWLHFSISEEVVGGGASYGLPEGVTEMLALDIGAVGPAQYSTEYKVSICARDAKWPYDYVMTTKLIDAAKGANVDYAVDIFHPRYGSDAQAAMSAGCNFRAALIGPGVYGTHGYERTHMKSLEHTFDLICAYLDM